MMKAFLKGADGTLFPLLPKITTIGRENCDFSLQIQGVDYQHCIIEYSDQDDCFVLQDLNTAQGTYVNEVRVQNAAVRLAPGDHVRFGYNGQPFELHVENQQTIGLLAGSQRPPIWTYANDQDAYGNYMTSQYGNAQGLPQIPVTVNSTQSASAWNTSSVPQTQQHPFPRPPLRSRPLSAGAVRRNVQGIASTGPPAQTINRPAVINGWVNQSLTRATSIPDMQEKDQKLAQLSEEVTRLRTCEYDSVRKDTLIHQLQQQIADLQGKLLQEPAVIMGGDMDMSAKLLHLETEVSTKKEEISALKAQLDRLQGDRSNSPLLLRQELGERVKEISQLRSELERVKKDKKITSGLVTQMQRDMSNKDSSISKLTREVEVLKKDIREREIHTPTSSAKKTKESPKAIEENNAREKELVTLRQKFKTAESKIQEQMDLVASLREELDKSKAQVFSEKDVQRKVQSDLDTAKSQLVDVQRTERVVRVDLEQAQKRMERLRSRLVQTIFSASSMKAPEKELSDDELITSLKQLMEERASLLSQIEQMEKDLTTAKAGKGDFLEKAEKLKIILEEGLTNLKTNGRLCSSLQQALDFLQTINTEPELLWVRDLVSNILTSEFEWEQKIEAALDKYGANTKISNDDPSQHIDMLFMKWESSLNQAEKLQKDIAVMEENHKSELQLQLDALRTEMENKIQDEVEKAKQECNETHAAALKLAVEEEQRKNEALLDAEKAKVESLESTLTQVRESMMSRQADDEARVAEATQALKEVEEFRILTAELREQLAQKEAQHAEFLIRVEAEKMELVTKLDTEITSYKEQIKQHSLTIVSMEEKMAKLVKKCKDSQEQLSKLRAEKSKPAPPPKPKVIIQRPKEELASLEQVVNALRQENTILKKEVREAQDVIMGLRRDLSGASARLSDISGEMSEAQKQEMERNLELLKQRGSELTELRQQMAQLSKIIDSQKEEMKKLEGELSSEKSNSAKFKSRLDEHNSHVQMLQDELRREKEEQRKQLELIDQEGRITSELTGLGAQCRGERHEQIIARQREALVELRSKVKNLEQSRPPLPTQDQALQQVVMLKKELAEMRVNQALAEDKIIQSATSLDREIGKARGLITPSNVEADMERSAHRETMDALECSEATYGTLLRAIAASLDLEEVDGLCPMAHIPRDEREELIRKRENMCELLANRIQVLKERIGRKDELLQGYEVDLSKLRHSQELADMRSMQVEKLANDIKSRSEESEYLRESLNRTRDRLNQEKRLNTAIKQKKTFHLENENAHLQNRGRGHHCPVEDPKTVAKMRRQKEVLKRKNYEIRTLKDDLCDTEKELYDREKRLMSFENSLGLERPATILE